MQEYKRETQSFPFFTLDKKNRRNKQHSSRWRESARSYPIFQGRQSRSSFCRIRVRTCVLIIDRALFQQRGEEKRDGLKVGSDCVHIVGTQRLCLKNKKIKRPRIEIEPPNSLVWGRLWRSELTEQRTQKAPLFHFKLCDCKCSLLVHLEWLPSVTARQRHRAGNHQNAIYYRKKARLSGLYSATPVWESRGRPKIIV